MENNAGLPKIFLVHSTRINQDLVLELVYYSHSPGFLKT